MTRTLCLLVSLTAASSLAEPTRHFEIDETFTVPAAATGESRQLFVPLPRSDSWQKVTALEVTPPAKGLEVQDPVNSDPAARFTVPPAGETIHVTFQVERRERAADLSRASDGTVPPEAARWLQDDARVKVTDRIRTIAAEQTKGLTRPLDRARALYDYVLKTMRYDKHGEGWGHGDITWACDKRYGNCTDFHAMLAGLLRASGIPARFQIGYAVPAGAAGEIPGYHCWLDFWVAGAGWIPVDASEAWKHPERRDYYFGHHDPDRVALSTGRDLSLPGMKGAPLNYFVFPYLEVDGKAGPQVERKVSFREL